MKFAGYITADFNPHPTATVVINSVHGAIGVIPREGIADHRVTLIGEVASIIFIRKDKDSSLGGTIHFGTG